jgi:glycosyltransferase involved in cell wall biosynthesis
MPGRDPLISIVLPTYNGSRFIRESLDSCLAQTYQNWELIIVDDCSTDTTPQIIAEYAARDSRIRVHRNKINLKLPASLNAGFDLARGEFLTWTSDDNAYRPEALAVMCQYLQDHPSVGVVYTDYSLIDDNSAIVEYVKVDPPEALAYRSCVGASFMYRRAVHDKLKGYDTNLFLVEDYDYWVRAWKEFELGVIHRDLYLYRRHSGSLSSQREDRILEATAALIRTHLPTIPSVNNKIRSRIHQKLATIDFHFGRVASARREFATAVSKAPWVLFSDAKFAAKLLVGKRFIESIRNFRQKRHDR